MYTQPSRHGSIPFAAIALIFAFIGVGCSASRDTSVQSIVEPEGLAEFISHDRPILLDVRTPDEYRAGHLDGAVHVDGEEWKDESLAAETGLDHAARWHERIGNLGVSGRQPVLIYDNGQMTEAARVWFVFQHFGVSHVAVLNGGYRALAAQIAAKQLVTNRELIRPVPVKFLPAGNSKASVALADKDRVREAVASGKAQIFDARTEGEFAGKDARGNPRAGHLPTARNLSHAQLLDEGGRVRPPAELAAMFEKAGFRKGEPIITHCQSGGRASLAALAARRAGYGPIWNYYLSFGEWSKDATCPIE